VSTALIPFTEVQGMADAIARSGLFGMKTSDQALALMLVAQAEGQHPATITQEYDIIQGRAARKTHSVLARFQAAGGTVEWHELSETIADATFSHKAGGKLRMSWTLEQAKKAKLTSKDNWVNYPRAMLRARVIAEGVRAVYPAALGGMLVAEEAMDITDDEPRAPAKAINPATGEIESTKPALPPYPADKFAHNLKTVWKKRVADGGDPANLIVKLKTLNTLTADQEAAVMALKPAAPAGGDAPSVTSAQVLEKLNASATSEDLDAAAGLIPAVPEAERAALNARYDELHAKFNPQE
jgi:hypothetical protein